MQTVIDGADCVLFAIGREPLTDIGLDRAVRRVTPAGAPGHARRRAGSRLQTRRVSRSQARRSP